MNRCKLLN